MTLYAFILSLTVTAMLGITLNRTIFTTIILRVNFKKKGDKKKSKNLQLQETSEL